MPPAAISSDTSSTARTPPKSRRRRRARSKGEAVSVRHGRTCVIRVHGRRQRERPGWHDAGDDSFELYDLRVEVVATERPMVCNHRAGDFFLPSGESLSLPPGQCFPIYPLAALLPLLPAKQRATHPNDWMTTDAEIACPDPHCGARFRITPHRQPHLPPCRGDGRAPCPQDAEMTVETFELAPGYRISRLLRAAGSWPAGMARSTRERAVADMVAFVDAGITAFDCADIYTGVEELIGAFRGARDCAAEALARMQGPHQVRARPRRAARARHAPMSSASSTARCAGSAWSGSTSSSSTGGTIASPGWLDTAGWLTDLRRAGKIDLRRRHQFRQRRTARMLDAGVPLASMQTQYSLLDARPEHGLTTLCARSRHEAAVLRHARRRLPLRALARRRRADRRLAQPLAGQIQADHRRFRRLGPVPGLLAALAGIAEKHGVGIANVATRWVLDRPHVAGAIVGARYAEQPRRQPARVRLRASIDADRPRSTASWPQRRGPSGDTYALERDRDGPHGRIMKYNLNAELIAAAAPSAPPPRSSTCTASSSAGSTPSTRTRP